MSNDEEWIDVSIPKGFVYVLQLKYNKYYVGFTERENAERLDEHLFSKCAQTAWTKKYKPLQVILYRQCESDDDENQTTLQMMKQYGWYNVRGGKWCQINLEGPPKELFELPSTGIIDKCVAVVGNLINFSKKSKSFEKNASGLKAFHIVNGVWPLITLGK